MLFKGISVVVLTIMFLVILSSGCTADNSKEQPCSTCTPPTPAPAAAQLHESGFHAYINRDFPTALDFFNKSIEADPKYTRAWIEKGNVLIQMNRTEEAISAYDSALTIKDDQPEIWNSRGEALMTLGKYAEAKESFEKALKLLPDFPTAKENRDLALAKMK